MKVETHLKIAVATTVIDALHQNTQISKSALKKALNYGGVWLTETGKKKKRCRKATKPLKPGAKLSLYFDDRLYNIAPPQLECLQATQHWGIWCKPAGVLSQASPYGDRGSLDYLIAQQQSILNSPHLINRLDREVSGLVLVAYNKQAAARLNETWARADTEKYYQAQVVGEFLEPEGVIDHDLDGKACTTFYKCIHFNAGQTNLQIKITSGRFHQIRRHLADIGHPVLGDPKYGTNNMDKRGLRLCAYELNFICPFSGIKTTCTLPNEKLLF